MSFFNEISKTATFEPDSVEFTLAKSYRKDYAVQSVHRGRIKLGDFYYEDKIILLSAKMTIFAHSYNGLFGDTKITKKD